LRIDKEAIRGLKLHLLKMHGQIAIVDNQEPVFMNFLHPAAFVIPNATFLP
jgi:hypothetical protein